jgi:hypothetical protein
MLRLSTHFYPPPDKNKVLVEELDDFFNNAIINFGCDGIYNYCHNIISSYLRYKNLVQLGQPLTEPVSRRTLQKQVKIILTPLFSKEVQAKCASIPLNNKKSALQTVLTSQFITEFPIRIMILASDYYSLPPGTSPFRHAYVPDAFTQYQEREGVKLGIIPKYEEETEAWRDFLSSCFEFRYTYGFFPLKVEKRLHAFNDNEGIPDNGSLKHMIKIINKYLTNTVTTSVPTSVPEGSQSRAHSRTKRRKTTHE